MLKYGAGTVANLHYLCRTGTVPLPTVRELREFLKSF